MVSVELIAFQMKQKKSLICLEEEQLTFRWMMDGWMDHFNPSGVSFGKN